jgi:hypothetical protein
MHAPPTDNSTPAPPALSPQIGLSLAALPLLAGLWSVRQLADWLQELGQLGEEIFRGERLPVLNFPPEEGTEPRTGNGQA